MQSIENIFDALVHRGPLTYVLTHKMSQDHAETFFGCARGRGGFNNNPTAAQFMAAYKRLLVKTEVKSSESGNCSPDVVSVLGTSVIVSDASAATAVTATRRGSLLQAEGDNYTHPIDYTESLSPLVSSVVPYIAGFVARKVAAKSTCDDCVTAVYSEEQPALVKQKSRGGLVSPSRDVISLCEMAEKGLRRLQAESRSIQEVHLKTKRLVLEVLSMAPERNWFSQLNEHLLDCDALDNHVYKLCKDVLELYIKIRIHHITKERNRGITKDKVRSVLSRLIIFKNQ